MDRYHVDVVAEVDGMQVNYEHEQASNSPSAVLSNAWNDFQEKYCEPDDENNIEDGVVSRIMIVLRPVTEAETAPVQDDGSFDVEDATP